MLKRFLTLSTSLLFGVMACQKSPTEPTAAPRAKIIAATEQGAYRSLDGGERWEAVNDGLPFTTGPAGRKEPLPVYRLAYNATARTLFVVTRGGLYRSFDEGRSWAHAGFESHDGVPAIGVDGKGAIYASTVVPTNFFRSGDNGQTWRSMREGLDQQGVIQALAFEGDVVYAGTSAGNLLRLRGERWELMHTFEAGSLWINALGVELSGVFLLGTSQGLYRMDARSGNNGNALVQIGADLGITSLVTALAVHHNKGTFVGTTRAVYSIDAGNKIKQVGEGASALVVTSEGEIFAGSSDGIRHSTDGGVHWDKLGLEAFIYSLIVVD
jgi:hypothetical protein